jgi:hypothetical protein
MKNFTSIVIESALLLLASGFASAAEVRELLIDPSPGSVIIVEQPLFDGQHARNASHGGVMDLSTQSVKWGPLTSSEELILTFDLVGLSNSPPSAQVRTDGIITTLDSYSGAETGSNYEEWLVQMYPPNQVGALSRSFHFDPDHDRLPNYAEFLLALDPSSFDSVNDLIDYLPEPDGGMVLELAHRADSTFQIRLEEVDLAGGTEPQAIEWTSSSIDTDTVTRRVELPARDMFFFRVVILPFPTE